MNKLKQILGCFSEQEHADQAENKNEVMRKKVHELLLDDV
jgi:hypothetical protein